MEEKQTNGLNLENILAKVPSEEIRNEMLVDAVERGLTDNPEYFDRAVQILEQEKKYAALASLYSNKERASYDADKALFYYQKAIASYGFKKDAEKRIGTGAVLGEMGRKVYVGFKETVKFISKGFILPTIIRRHDDRRDDVLPYALIGIIEGVVSIFSPTFLALSRGHSPNNMDVYDFMPLIAFGASNVVSGLYEWYRYEKNKLQEKTGKSGLEERVEESHEKVSQDSAPALTIEEATYNPMPTAGRQKITQ